MEDGPTTLKGIDLALIGLNALFQVPKAFLIDFSLIAYMGSP